MTELKSKMVAAIREVAKKRGIEIGQPGPGRGTFFAEADFTPYDLTRCGWVNWSDALAEAGYLPNALQSAIPDDVLLEHLARLTRQIGRFPTHNHVRVAGRMNPALPSLATFARLGSQDERQRILREWCMARADYSDIIAILEDAPLRIATETRAPASTETVGQSLSHDLVPPIIAALPQLSIGAPAIAEACRLHNKSVNSEFERRVGTAFTILGFLVESLGQGKGVVADGVAKCPERQWAVIYDAKVRGSGYRLLTEDRRKFRDYINIHQQRLTSEGIRRIYFAVISSEFTARDLERAREVKSGSDARACVLIEAGALVALVERRIARPREYSVETLERIFEETRILLKTDI
ncbi:MAG: hypothetical protein ABSE64_11880 [Vulcanimicrobiaceae bacterium]|jgi:hypothetical protein